MVFRFIKKLFGKEREESPESLLVKKAFYTVMSNYFDQPVIDCLTPGRLENGRLEINCELDYMEELNTKRETLLSEINSLLGQPLLKSMRFRH